MQCSRCGTSEAVVKTRGEHFCSQCYVEFIGRKFRTAMSAFRVSGAPGSRTEPPLVLAPVSFGASSLAMVDLLVEMQRAQRAKHSGMTGLRVRCLYIGDADAPHAWPWPEAPLVCVPRTELFTRLLPELGEKGRLSRSSRQDMESILLRQACLGVAAEIGASATVFGCSMTRLSELTLSETVKGRGAGIPELVSPAPAAGMLYPLRDVTAPELEKYCAARGLQELVLPDPTPPGITKMQSIDEIVHAYFADVQQSFPSVVSTVAKVASKLAQDGEPCGLCRGGAGAGDAARLCYACEASLGERLEPQGRASLADILQEYALE